MPSVRSFLSTLLCLLIFTAASQAQDSISMAAPFERFYWGSSFDAGIFSTATIQKTGLYTNPYNNNAVTPYTTNSTGILRFSYIINYGFTFNLNLTRHVGIFTGLDLKNIGYIDHVGNETIKRRTYNLGAPLGLRLGRLRRKGHYLFFGGGLDFALNYKEKEFQVRSDKSKFNEWFSDRTPHFMPYVFVGIKTKPGFTFKFQYYPNNFLNSDYVAASGGTLTMPYANTTVHLILFSIGYDMHGHGHKKKSPTRDKAPDTYSL